jgi:hypothetical protein
MLSRLLSLIAVLCLSSVLQAQEEAPPPIMQIYGGYNYISNGINGIPGSHKALNGWDASVAFKAWHEVRFKIDFPGYRGTNLGTQEDFYAIMGGAQYSHRVHRETVYVEGLGGDAGANKYWGPQGHLGQTVAFAAFIGGGLDTPITRHIAFRVDGGFQYFYFALDNNAQDLVPYRPAGLPTNFGRVSSGLVWEF